MLDKEKCQEMLQELWQPCQSRCFYAERSPIPSGAHQWPAADSAFPRPLGKGTFGQQSKEKLLRRLQRAGLWQGGDTWHPFMT